MRNLLSRLPAWPASCEVCARWPARPVCESCLVVHGRIAERCPSCALPMAPGLSSCMACRNSTTPSHLSHCAARVDYAYPWGELIHRFKHNPAGAHTLAELLLQAPYTVTLLEQADLIVPIPLHPSKLRQRGYNQAWELIKALQRQHPTRAQALPDLLIRYASQADQHTLGRNERLGNAQHAFTMSYPLQPRLRGRRVLLVDDVMTTGSTLQAAAAVLLHAGARQVTSLVFARTPAPSLL